MQSTKQNKWNTLSMRDRAELMRIFVKHGIYDLQQIKDTYNNFDSTETNTQQEYVDTYSNGGNLFFAGGENDGKGDNPPQISAYTPKDYSYLFSRDYQLQRQAEQIQKQQDNTRVAIQPKINKQITKQDKINYYRGKQKEVNKKETPIQTKSNARINSPITYWFSDIFNNQLNKIENKFNIDLGVNGQVHSEKDFTNRQLGAIYDLIKSSGDKYVSDSLGYNNLQSYFDTNPNDTLDIPITGQTYKDLKNNNYYGELSVRDLPYKLLNPLGQVEHIIGRTNQPAKVHKNGVRLVDSFDFNTNSGVKIPTLHPYSLPRYLSTKFGHSNVDSDKGKHLFDINLQVNDWNGRKKNKLEKMADYFIIDKNK